jgi:hypothetical protein
MSYNKIQYNKITVKNNILFEIVFFENDINKNNCVNQKCKPDELLLFASDSLFFASSF